SRFDAALSLFPQAFSPFPRKCFREAVLAFPCPEDYLAYSRRARVILAINAALQPPPAERVAALEILNPFNDKEALDDKLSVVDIKARDQSGRQFNVEMQLLPYGDFRQRVLYYWARLYQQQLHESEEYELLRPTISICFVNRVLFPKVPTYHLSFQLREPNHQVVFTEDLALHMLELPKFTRSAAELVTPLDAW